MFSLFIRYLKDCYLAFSIIIIINFVKIILKKFTWNDFFSRLEQKRQNRVKLFKSIYINFRSFPFHQAIKSPIYIYGKINIPSLSGNMYINSTNIDSGMIQIGYTWGFRSQGITRICNEGNIIFNGTCLITKGSEVVVRKNAKIEFGNRNVLGENTMIMCRYDIKLGNHVRLSYHSQIMDTDYHYILSVENREIKPRDAKVEIGDYNWIGNKTTIKKGVKTPAYIVVAGSNSVLTKDYTIDVSPYSILGGCPAKVIGKGLVRIWNNEMNRIIELDSFFKNNPEIPVYKLDINEKIEDYI